MKKQLELEDASNLDDEKDIIKPNPFWQEENDERCEKHKELRGNCCRMHYGTCVYCILDGTDWHEECISQAKSAILSSPQRGLR
jgi:hypothetical protein